MDTVAVVVLGEAQNASPEPGIQDGGTAGRIWSSRSQEPQDGLEQDGTVFMEPPLWGGWHSWGGPSQPAFLAALGLERCNSSVSA